jgi:hypothetical protein
MANLRFAYVPGTSTINVRDMDSGALVGTFDYFKGVPNEYKDEFETRMSAVSDSWIRGFEKNLADVETAIGTRGGSPTVGDYEAGRAGRERVEFARQTAEDIAAEEARQAREAEAKNAVTNDLEASRLPPVKPSGVTTPTQARNYDKTNAKPGTVRLPKGGMSGLNNSQHGQSVSKDTNVDDNRSSPISNAEESGVKYIGNSSGGALPSMENKTDTYNVAGAKEAGQAVIAAEKQRINRLNVDQTDANTAAGTRNIKLSAPPPPPPMAAKGSQITKAEQMRQIYAHVKDGQPDDWLKRHTYEFNLFNKYNADGTPKKNPADVPIEPSSEQEEWAQAYSTPIRNNTPPSQEQMAHRAAVAEQDVQPAVTPEVEAKYRETEDALAEQQAIIDQAKLMLSQGADTQDAQRYEKQIRDAEKYKNVINKKHQKYAEGNRSTSLGDYNQQNAQAGMDTKRAAAQEKLTAEYNDLMKWIQQAGGQGGYSNLDPDQKSHVDARIKSIKRMANMNQLPMPDLPSDSRLKMIKPTRGILNGVLTKY